MNKITAWALAATLASSAFADVDLAKVDPRTLTKDNAIEATKAYLAATNVWAVEMVAKTNLIDTTAFYNLVSEDAKHVKALAYNATREMQKEAPDIGLIADTLGKVVAANIAAKDDNEVIHAYLALVELQQNFNKKHITEWIPEECIIAVDDLITAKKGQVATVLLYAYQLYNDEDALSTTRAKYAVSLFNDYLTCTWSTKIPYTLVDMNNAIRKYLPESEVDEKLATLKDLRYWTDVNFIAATGGIQTDSILYARIREAVAKNAKLTDNQRIYAAKTSDMFANNKKLSSEIALTLKSLANQLDMVAYANDNSLLITWLNNATADLDAKTIDKAITLAANVPAGFNDEALLKGLKSVNRKYTMKLYDDRDTWEPVLSKLRALIDTL